jgi:hypothetical protein
VRAFVGHVREQADQPKQRMNRMADLRSVADTAGEAV